MEINLIIMILLPLGLLAAFIVFTAIKKRKPQEGGVQDFRGKFERKYYKFHNGLEACQEQLNLKQNESYTQLLDRVEIGDASGMTLERLNKMLYADKGMRDLLGIVLLNNDGGYLNDGQKALALTLKDDEVEAVLNDFFTLNPQKKALFELIKLAAVSQMSMVRKSTDGTLKKAG